jgi:hypothetical protein
VDAVPDAERGAQRRDLLADGRFVEAEARRDLRVRQACRDEIEDRALGRREIDRRSLAGGAADQADRRLGIDQCVVAGDREDPGQQILRRRAGATRRPRRGLLKYSPRSNVVSIRTRTGGPSSATMRRRLDPVKGGMRTSISTTSAAGAPSRRCRDAVGLADDDPWPGSSTIRSSRGRTRHRRPAALTLTGHPHDVRAANSKPLAARICFPALARQSREHLEAAAWPRARVELAPAHPQPLPHPISRGRRRSGRARPAVTVVGHDDLERRRPR